MGKQTKENKFGIKQIICDCGKAVELHDSLTNECDRCGQEWNGVGQALRKSKYSDYEIAMGLDN